MAVFRSGVGYFDCWIPTSLDESNVYQYHNFSFKLRFFQQETEDEKIQRQADETRIEFPFFAFTHKGPLIVEPLKIFKKDLNIQLLNFEIVGKNSQAYQVLVRLRGLDKEGLHFTLKDLFDETFLMKDIWTTSFDSFSSLVKLGLDDSIILQWNQILTLKLNILYRPE